MTWVYTRRALGCLLAVIVLMPVHAYLTREVSVSARALVAVAAAVAFVSPSTALLALAGLIPIASATLGPMFSAATYPGEAFLLAVLGGWLLRFSLRVGRDSGMPTGSAIQPAWLLLVVFSASVVVRLFGIQPRVDFPLPFVREVFAFLSRNYFANHGEFDVITTASTALESIGVFLGVGAIVGRRPELAPRVLRMVGVGAIAAALNISRFAIAAVRTGAFVESASRMLLSIRISSAFADYNAAGSYFALTWLVLLGLAISERNRARGSAVSSALSILTAAIVLTLVGLAAWLTGSRTAVVAVTLFVAVLAIWEMRRRLPVVIAAGLAGVALLGVLASAEWMNPPQSTGRSIGAAADIRRHMAMAAVRMTADQPVFGAGLGAFHAQSNQYLDPTFRAIIPRENAHNNYLQVLAETGIVGLAVFMWTIVAAFAPAFRRPGDQTNGALRRAVAAGLAAFGATCLTGHPLLVFEVSITFWLVLGCYRVMALAASDRPLEGPVGSGRWIRTAVVAAMAVVVCSVPFRGAAEVADANLQSASIGFSEWQSDQAGVRLRRILGPAQFYVPSDTTFVQLPVLLEREASTAAEFEIRIDGQIANRVPLVANGWATVGFQLPRRSSERRYIPVQVSAFDRAGRRVSDGSVCLGTPRTIRSGG